jgi:hypothetical protein
MGILLIIVFLGLSSWALIALFRRLQRQNVSTTWRIAAGGLFVCGAALGIWCALYCEYHVGARYRIASFPLPAVIFHLEDGAWVDFPVPKFQAWLTIFVNIITVSAVTTMPAWLIFWCKNKHGDMRADKPLEARLS